MNRKAAALWKLWDVLAWVTVIFPLLTGGVWIRNAHLKIELSQVTAPVIALALLIWILPASRGERVSRFRSLSSVRFGLRVWRTWDGLLKRMPGKTVGLATLIVGGLWTLASLERHWAFGSNAGDLGIFTSAIWNLIHGNGYVSAVKNGMNLFADHQSPIFWGVVPLFSLWPHAETLLVVQGFGLATGGAAAWALGRQYDHSARPWLVSLLPLLYWAYLPVRNANAFDFHPETLLLPLFLFAIWGLQETILRRRALGLLFLVLALACKESAGPVCVGIGMAWMIGAGPERSRRFTRLLAGPAAICLGLAVFLFDTRVVPGLLGTTYAYNENFAHFGNDGLLSVLRAPFAHPGIFFRYLLGVERLRFLFLTIAPLAFLPLLGPRALVGVIPGYLMIFLSSGTHRVQLIYHYAIEPAVGLFWATASVASAQLKPKLSGRGLAVWTVVFALAFLGRSDLYRIRIFQRTPHSEWVRLEALPALASEVSISSSSSITPHVADRLWAHHLPNLRMPAEAAVDCVIYDGELNNFPMADEDTRVLLQETLPRMGYAEEFRCETFRAWARGGAHCFRALPVCPAAP